MSSKKIKIAVASFNPITIVDGKKYGGFEIELWEKVAQEINMEYKYTKSKFSEIFRKLVNNKVDLAIAGISKTAEREEIIDFSHNTFNSGLAILVNKKNSWNLFKLLGVVFNKNIKSVLIILLLFVVVAANLLWLAERGSPNTINYINNNYFPGIFEALWWSIVTVSTVGYGDFVPGTWIGRLVGSVVILTGLGIFGLYIAKVSSAITLRELKSNISGKDDLKGKMVATKKGTTSVDALNDIGANVVEVEEINEAYDKLAKGKVDAVVFDAPIIFGFVNGDVSHKFTVVDNLFMKQPYAFALPEGSKLVEPINRAILKLRENGVYKDLYIKWFGDEKYY